MNMKFKLLAAMTLAFGLFSCSSEKGLDNSAPDGQGILGNAETYATISIAMPGGDMTGKALTKTDFETGDGTEQGTGMENNFNSISLYFFEGSESASACKGLITLRSDQFTKGQDESKNIVYTTSEPLKVGIVGEDMPVYAVLNGNGVPGVNVGTKLEDFLKTSVLTGDAISADWLLMTSRNPGIVSIRSAENNTPDKAANLAVEVERTAAKISYMAKKTDNRYSVENETASAEVATVTLDEFKLVNLRNDAYFFRKVAGADGQWQSQNNFGSGILTSGNYVIDPYFIKKTVAKAAEPGFTAEWFGEGRVYASNEKEYATLPTATDYSHLGYCMENTTTQDAQLNGYSTGIIFKATFAPKQVYVYNADKKEFEAADYAPGTTFYRYANVLYKDKKEIADYYKIEENSSLIEAFTGDNATGATCYYKYWIRHMDNGESENMGVMEFAIVRNNVYKLAVEKVSDLGDPTDEINPENPDETSKMYLTVKVSILPWVVRNNDNIIL